MPEARRKSDFDVTLGVKKALVDHLKAAPAVGRTIAGKYKLLAVAVGNSVVTMSTFASLIRALAEVVSSPRNRKLVNVYGWPSSL